MFLHKGYTESFREMAGSVYGIVEVAVLALAPKQVKASPRIIKIYRDFKPWSKS